MESGQRMKKSSNKKKNMQATTLTESVTNDGRESTSNPRSHVVETDRDMDVQFSGATVASNDGGRKMDSDTDGHFSNGIEEASFEEKIKQLQAEKDAQMQKEAIFEDKIKNLLREKDENLQKLAGQKETIRQLHSEKIACIQKEDMLEERYKQLQREMMLTCRKRITNYLDGLKESIAALSNDSKKLQAQVMELEESRTSLRKEKQELIEKVSSLQLHIDNLESTITYSHPNMNSIVTSEDGNADHQREVMPPPSEKLVPENP